MAEFHGEIQNGEIILSNVQCELRRQMLAGYKNGTRIRENIIREGQAKSCQQVRAHFGLVVEMVRRRLYEMGVDVCGVPVNKEMVHDILKKVCGGVGYMGETLGLSEMTTMQASQFFENCRTWAATQLQLDIPNPDPLWKEKK